MSDGPRRGGLPLVGFSMEEGTHPMAGRNPSGSPIWPTYFSSSWDISMPTVSPIASSFAPRRDHLVVVVARSGGKKMALVVVLVVVVALHFNHQAKPITALVIPSAVLFLKR